MFEAQVTTEGQKWVLEQNLGIVWSLYGQHFAPTPELLSQQPDNYSTLSCCIRRKENELWRPPYSGTAGIVLRAGMRYRVENWVMGGTDKRKSLDSVCAPGLASNQFKSKRQWAEVSREKMELINYSWTFAKVIATCLECLKENSSRFPVFCHV